MSTAAATTTPATEAPPPAKSKKKLIVIIAAAALLLAVAGGAAVFLLKKKSLDADSDGDDHAPVQAAAKHDAHASPTFVPLDPFTVNLADRDAERYAQVGITLEIEDAHLTDQIKTFMPAIRNNILLAIADRTAADLMGRDGKAELAQTIRRETSRVLGYQGAGADAVADTEGADKGDDATARKPRKKPKKPVPEMPIKAVHFSNFIIQ